MKTYTVGMAGLVAAAVITLAGSAFAGQTQAERENALGQKSDTESMLGWQIRPALEAGSLPADHAKASKPESAAKTEPATVEIGGIVYTIGLDFH